MEGSAEVEIVDRKCQIHRNGTRHVANSQRSNELVPPGDIQSPGRKGKEHHKLH
jgi:hypothetical protein